MSIRSARIAGGATSLVTLTLLVGCGNDPKADSSPIAVPSSSAPSTAPSVSPSLTPREIAERDAVAAYRGFVAAWVDSAKTGNSDVPRLEQHSQGKALKMVITTMIGYRALGKVARGEPVIDPKIRTVETEQNPTRVTLKDCFDSTNWLEYKKSGGLWDEVPGGRRTTYVAVVKTGTGWKVDIIGADDEAPC